MATRFNVTVLNVARVSSASAELVGVPFSVFSLQPFVKTKTVCTSGSRALGQRVGFLILGDI